MLRTILKSKIHRATVTEANIEYMGSITIDANLMEAANILNHEKVQVVDVTNGIRLETYAIAGKRGTGIVCLNGAAAHLIHKGDIIIVLSYAMVNEEEAKKFVSKIVHVDKENKIIDSQDYLQEFDVC